MVNGAYVARGRGARMRPTVVRAGIELIDEADGHGPLADAARGARRQRGRPPHRPGDDRAASGG